VKWETRWPRHLRSTPETKARRNTCEAQNRSDRCFKPARAENASDHSATSAYQGLPLLRSMCVFHTSPSPALPARNASFGNDHPSRMNDPRSLASDCSDARL